MFASSLKRLRRRDLLSIPILRAQWRCWQCGGVIPCARALPATAEGAVMQGVRTATILTFPKRSAPERALSGEGDLAQLRQVQLACATALRDCAVALEGLARALKSMIDDTSRD
jgi:hypothetical protein